MSAIDVRKKFLRLAYEQLNPKLDSLDGLQQALINWYCFQYNTPPNDQRLLSMTLEELLILQQMHKIKENPQLADEVNPDYEDYETWLKREMGQDYVDEEAMIQKALAVEAEEKALAEKLPEKIHTDFTKILNQE